MSGTPDRLFALRVLREECERAGFTGFGVARAGPAPGFERFRRWIAAGHHAGMRYLQDTLPVRESPQALLTGARSVICLSAPYGAAPRVAADGSRFARYAQDQDYHGTLRGQAVRAAERSRERVPGTWSYRVCVDSTPVAERAFAAAAGLGWIGKNGCLMNARDGSYVLLAEILTDLDLPPDQPVAEQCGSCTRCLDACPTDAFVEPGVLDANRCLAYWTIEHRGPIPDSWKRAVGEHVFGCDLCQEVCPWNVPLQALARAPSPAPPTRLEVLTMGKGQWRRRFGKTAVNRAARRGLQRNAAASAGACGDGACRSALETAAAVPDSGLSDAARWALPRLRPHPL
ncbi:MAG: tRNA epoxyqueuosine(34) reductase QueG [Acidobacteriota bacterium]